MTSPADIPDDIDALKALLVAAEAQINAQNRTLDVGTIATIPETNQLAQRSGPFSIFTNETRHRDFHTVCMTYAPKTQADIVALTIHPCAHGHREELPKHKQVHELCFGPHPDH